MAAPTRFRLTLVGQQMIARGQVTTHAQFRTMFSGTDMGGATRIYNQRRCPIISVDAADVLQTSDDFAIACLAVMEVRNLGRRNGQMMSTGLMFEDVTGSTVEGDVTVNLDTLFDTVRHAAT